MSERGYHWNRRTFLKGTAALLAAGLAEGSAAPPTTQLDARSVFTVDKRRDHWWLITPEGEPFFSIGMNHIDSATLRYGENGRLWQEKYGNSQQRWLKEGVARDLRAWGFNTVGWVQEVVVRGLTQHRHSRNFTYEEYQWLDMPYCHMLPFADFHQWEAETRHPDFFSADFENWCDYVARAECARMADDPKLIGYFYIDCPTWVHTRPYNEWKGPLFDPQRLESEAGRRKLLELAGRYYQVTHDAVRRYDRRHLILGDRYEAKALLADEVLLAAAPYVDVISVQYFDLAERIVPRLRQWSALTGRPALLADAAVPGRRADRPPSRWTPGYEPTIKALREEPSCIGWHVCGAYLTNRVRGHGFRDEQEQADEEFLSAVAAANRQTEAWVSQAARSLSQH